jgi:hypothetical protein
MSFNVLNSTNAPVDFTDAGGVRQFIQPGGSMTVGAITASLYRRVVENAVAIQSVVADDAYNAALINELADRAALDKPYAVTCTAGTAMLSAAQVSLLAAPFISTVGISAAGAVAPGTATTTPILPDGTDGQKLKLVNVGAQTITLTDQGTMAASNLRLTAATVAIAARQSIELTFIASIGDWVQTGALVAVI